LLGAFHFMLLEPGIGRVELDFQQVFGSTPSHAASAPGRINLIGDHTDYQGGYVLPVATPQRTLVQLRPRPDAIMRVISANQPGNAEPLEFRLGEERPGRGWLDYVQGVTHVLRRQPISGADLFIRSEVPLGAGLASSAALEVALLRCLRAAFSLQLDDLAIAALGRQAENDFVGVPTGVMDQMASSLAQPGSALFIDTRDLEVESIVLPSDLAVIAIGSGTRHELANSEYAQRRSESEQAAQALGVRELREASIDALGRAAALPPVLAKRARHIISENGRVLQARLLLREQNQQGLGALLLASHNSLRDDYAVSTPDLDHLVELAVEHGAIGARMTGGGFGGAIVALVPTGQAPSMLERVLRDYAARGKAADFAFQLAAAGPSAQLAPGA
jgi:galactokinase